jgi:hypothetical protein
MQQLITPNPDVPCKAGWCLQYVNDAFNVEAVYGSATDAWYGSTARHEDFNFPSGVWFPVHFALSSEPNGHVALMAPDGTVYSTSDYANRAHHHTSLDDLMSYYAYYGMTLYYRGWTEDVENTPVIAPTINAQSTTIQENDLTNVTDDQLTRLLNAADRVNGVITDEHAKVLTTNDIDDIANAVLDMPVAGLDSNGNPINTTLRTKIKYMAPNHTEIHNIVTHIDQVVSNEHR